MRDKLVFLDLEDTIIDSWESGLLVNTRRVQQFLQQHNATEVGIFSFAMWTDKQKKEFDTDWFRGTLERAFAFKVVLSPTVEEMTRDIFWKTGTVMDISETIAIWGKQRTFIDWCIMTQPAKHCILVDDVVDDMVLNNKTHDMIIECVNVIRLPHD